MSILMLGDGEVRSLLTMREAVEAVEEAFAEKNLGRVQSPMKTFLFYEKYNGDHRFMPAYLEKLNISGVKIVNTHPENRRRFKLPTVAGIIVLASARMAQFMNENVPGIVVPQATIDELAGVEKGQGLAKGIEIAARLIKAIKEENLCPGVHIMAVGREAIVPEIMEAAELISVSP